MLRLPHRERDADHTGMSAICENARGRGRVVLGSRARSGHSVTAA